MTRQNEVDVRSYVYGIGIPVRYIPTVAEKLEAVAPVDIDAAERGALERVKNIAQQILDVKNDRDRAPVLVRDYRIAFANAWSGVHSALYGAASVRADVSARGNTARMLLDVLFPGGVAFVNDDAPAAWPEGVRRFQRLDAEKLRDALVGVVGADLVTTAEHATRELRDAVLGTRTIKTALDKKRTQFSRAFARYARVLAAKLDEDDDASIERFKSAIAPADEYRHTRRREEDELDEDILDPAPPAEPVAPQPPPA